MKKINWPLAIMLCLVLLVVAAHLVLRSILTEGNVVSTLFAAGGHVPTSSLVLAVSFLVSRLVAILLVPAVLVGVLVASWPPRLVRR